MSFLRDAIDDFLHKADLVLLALCAAATLYGTVLVYSATRYDVRLDSCAKKQLVALALGLVCYVIFSYIDLDIIMEHWRWLLVGSVGFLLLLRTPLGDHVTAARTGNLNWLNIPGIPFAIQPAEYVKLAFILLLAKHLVWLRNNQRSISSLPSMLHMCVNFLFFAGLVVVISHDAGMACIYAGIFLVMIWTAGVSKWWFLGGITALGGTLGGGLFLLSKTTLWARFIDNYRVKRILILFDHEMDPRGAGWHQTRAMMALGSGGLTGQGYMQGIQTQSTSSSSLPARYTDFIFSSCGEELGLIGCMLILLLLGAIILRCLFIGMNAPSKFSAFVAYGVAGMLLSQTLLNVGMCLFVAPVVGITLPFFSYGGSSILTMFIAMGLVSGIKARSLPSWLKDRSLV